MSDKSPEAILDEARRWWTTSIIDVHPGEIGIRGYPIQDLIGQVSFPQMMWLLLRGDLPTEPQARLVEAALVAGVDHGPHAPSIAVARMAATCGVGLNNAMASAINVLGDSHGGAGQECVVLLDEIRVRAAAGASLPATVDEVVAEWRARGIRHLPGFGHRFHTHDPRRDPLLALVEAAVADGTVDGEHLRAALGVEEALNRGRTRPVPMNIDGATAVIYAELGFPAPLARGLFVLSRSVGILAHAWEETGQGRRNKGPIPPSIRPTYLG